MELAKLKHDEGTHIRVQSGGYAAQCPHCEAAEFLVTASATVFACGTCGADVGRAGLVEQLATAARLTAEVLAEQARRAPRLLD